MNIWLPIVTNIVLALILLAGAFIGRKNGWLQLIKLPFVLGSWVGCYFLNPIVVKGLLSIKTIYEQITIQTLPILISITLLLLCLVSYAFISLIILIVRKIVNRHAKVLSGVNKAKRQKIKGIDRQTTRALRREERKARKANREIKKLNKLQQIVGAIFGFILAASLSLILIMPLKYVFYQLAEEPKLAEAIYGYEYTPYGQLDKATNLYDTLLVDQFYKLGE